MILRRVGRPPRGAVLLEVLVALTILATAAASIAALTNDAARTVLRARQTESELRRASAFVEAVALWPREDLDRHLGERYEGPWLLRVLRPTETLYTVWLLDSTGTRELLRTTLYRRDTVALEASRATR